MSGSPLLHTIDSAPGIIGVVGGVGPLAGIDLQGKIVAQTIAARDQDHLPVISVSWPGAIPDRTAFLLGSEPINPAYPILEQLRLLAAMGATVTGIPCNTAHAPAIFEVIRDGVDTFDRPPRLLHMIEATAEHLITSYPTLKTIGVLSTTGTWQTRLYPNLLEARGLCVLTPDEHLQPIIHAAVYDPGYGIKSCGRVTTRARNDLAQAIARLGRNGAEAVILGCTEMPLAFPDAHFEHLRLIDPTLILARALIAAIAPDRLKPDVLARAAGT